MKKLFYALIILFPVLFVGCKSTQVSDTAIEIAESNAKIEKIAESIERNSVDIQSALEEIESSALKIQDSTERLIYLFEKYDELFQMILNNNEECLKIAKGEE